MTNTDIWNIFLGALASTFFSIIFVFWIQKKQHPVLKVSIEQPTLELNYEPGRPAKKHKATRLVVENMSLGAGWGAWLFRNAAENCRATITFHHINDGQNYFGSGMTGRWARSPQPIPLTGEVGGTSFLIWDTERLTTESKTDIHPGERTELDIAARFDNDQEAYGWNNEAYFCNPPWRTPHWRVPQGRYIVKVVILASSVECVRVFRLCNEGGIENFRLELPLNGDFEMVVDR